jgi:hypothetical protein
MSRSELCPVELVRISNYLAALILFSANYMFAWSLVRLYSHKELLLVHRSALLCPCGIN